MIPLRLAREYIHQLERAAEHDRLRHALTTIPLFITLYHGETKYEVLRHWAGSDQETTGTAYRKKLADWRARRQPDAEELDDVLTILTTLLTDIGRWQDAMALCNERVEIACSTGNRAREAWALETLGWLEYLRGEYAESEKHVREAESIARELKIPRLVAATVGRRGLVLYSLGEYDRAMACYAEQESIARDLGDRRNLNIAIGNRGNIHADRGEYDEAVACYRQQEEFAREIGDRQSIAVSVGNRGLVHADRRQYDEALECFREWEDITREIGDRRNVAVAVGNRGTIHLDLGEYGQALECFREQEEISRELGNRSTTAFAMGNRARVHFRLGEYADALECYEQACDIHRAIGFRYGVCFWLDGIARVLLEIVESNEEMPQYLAEHLPDITDETWRATALGRARERAEECLAISRELSQPHTLASSQELLARIEELTASAGWDHV